MARRNLTLRELKDMVKQAMNESSTQGNDVAHGHKEINDMQRSLTDDEYIWLDDSTGELTGTKVTKKEYAIRALRSAQDEKNWAKVSSAITFIKTHL